MPESKKISLFWWSEPRLLGKKKENYGDLLSKYLVEKISGVSVNWIQPKKQKWYSFNKTHILGAGSIIHHATKHSVVWGSGIIDENQKIAPARFKAVRGPETRKYLMNYGYKCPEIYGDPALLLPDYYNPNVKKKYKIGIIPHYTDFEVISNLYSNIEGVKVIDIMTLDIEGKTDEILECERIVSSSLHGVIIPHAYGISALWIPFSQKPFGNGIKYYDYLNSVQIKDYTPPEFNENISIEELLSYFDKYEALPNSEVINQLKQGLILNCPFIS